MLGKECLWQLQKLEGIGSDSWKHNQVNAESVTSLKFSYVHTSKFAYGSLHYYNIIQYLIPINNLMTIQGNPTKIETVAS